jgi:hypothetical protein
MHYYDSMLVIEKGEVSAPHDKKTGTPSFRDGLTPSGSAPRRPASANCRTTA